MVEQTTYHHAHGPELVIDHAGGWYRIPLYVIEDLPLPRLLGDDGLFSRWYASDVEGLKALVVPHIENLKSFKLYAKENGEL